MFTGKARAYLIEAISAAPLLVRLLALPTNIRQGWKGLPGKNALAYSEYSYITDIKSFKT
jgi:hypothetical protein